MSRTRDGRGRDGRGRAAGTAAFSGARTVAGVLALVITAAVGSITGCGETPAPRPNVLIVTLDSLRADRLGAYGQTARSITPRLDELARQSVVFRQAFSTSSFTPPTHASIFTGLYPSEHGMVWWSHPLAAVPTAAEVFQAAGYRTGAFTPLLSLLKLGLDRGFTAAESPPARQEQTADGEQLVLASADTINAAALPFLTSQDPRPFFAWVHYYDAHRPYGRQGPEWSGRFLEGGTDDLKVGATERWYQLTPARRAALGLTPPQTALIKDHYDGGAAYLDDRVGRLIDGLSAAGLLENTIVVLIADHGEVLDEHEAEWFSHDPWLVDENVRVPFLVRLPRGEHGGTRVDDLVSQVDVLPMLLALTGVPARRGAQPLQLSGLDLTPTWQGHRLAREAIYADRQGDDRDGKTGSRSRMLRTATRKLFHDEDRNALELWSVDADAQGGFAECVDITQQDHDGKTRLVKAYWGLRETLHLPGAATGHGDIDPALEEQLRQLNYIEGPRSP